MKGSVRKITLPSGTVVWRLQVDAGRDEHGKRIRISKNFKRKGEADDELVRILRDRQQGKATKDSADKLGEFVEEWVAGHAERVCTPKTVERYRGLIGYVTDALGHVPLKDLSTLMIERCYGKLQAGAGKSGRPLAAKTLQHIHGTLRAALGQAVKWNRLIVNPALACELPKPDETEAIVLEENQLDFLLGAALGHPWARALLITALGTGCRRGELCALRWADADLMRNSLSVSRSLEQTKAGLRIKGTKGRKARRMTLPAAVADALREHRRKQQANREAFGESYRADLDLVFATPEGDYLKPNSVSSIVCDLAARAGLPGIGLHSLRHTHGSQLLAAGVPLPTVSKRLGHRSVRVTAEIYAHSFEKHEAAAAETWDLKIGELIRKPAEKLQ